MYRDFQPGDKVTIKSLEQIEREFKPHESLPGYLMGPCGMSFNPRMKEFCGKTCAIKCHADEYGEIWYFDYSFERDEVVEEGSEEYAAAIKRVKESLHKSYALEECPLDWSPDMFIEGQTD